MGGLFRVTTLPKSHFFFQLSNAVAPVVTPADPTFLPRFYVKHRHHPYQYKYQERIELTISFHLCLFVTNMFTNISRPFQTFQFSNSDQIIYIFFTTQLHLLPQYLSHTILQFDLRRSPNSSYQPSHI